MHLYSQVNYHLQVKLYTATLHKLVAVIRIYVQLVTTASRDQQLVPTTRTPTLFLLKYQILSTCNMQLTQLCGVF